MKYIFENLIDIKTGEHPEIIVDEETIRMIKKIQKRARGFGKIIKKAFVENVE